MNSQNNDPKRIYVVLGMARSGTSAITRGLKALGIDLGDKFLAGGVRWNPTGFWEDTDIVYDINQKVFQLLNHRWMTIQMVAADSFKHPGINKITQRAVNLLQQRFRTTNHWGFKDPRSTKLVPFWRNVFKTMAVEDCYVIALRNPVSSALSNQTLSGQRVETGLLYWVIHMIAAIENTQGKQRVIVSYEALLNDARQQLSRIKQQLSIPLPDNETEVNLYVDHFINQKLQRHPVNDADLMAHPAIAAVPLAARIYFLLLQVAKDELSLTDEVFQSAWQDIKSEFQRIYPCYQYVDNILTRTKLTQKWIKKVKKSISWRLIYPLRLLDDYFRAKRKMRRKQKRLGWI